MGCVDGWGYGGGGGGGGREEFKFTTRLTLDGLGFHETVRHCSNKSMRALAVKDGILQVG